MISNQRVIFDNNGVLYDYSVELCDYRAKSVVFDYTAGEDALYIGTYLPFNHKYIELDVANDQASVATINVWDGEEWISTVDKLDRTVDTGASFGQSGRLQFTPDREESWVSELDSFDVSGLGGTEIYQMYWLRLMFSQTFNAATKIKYIGHKFCEESEMLSYHPDLRDDNLKNSYESGKTTWDEQIYIASDVIIRDLKARNILKTADQVLEPGLFLEAAAHKTAEIIYGAFGTGYADEKKAAMKRYEQAINIKNFNVDKDKNARLSTYERFETTGRLLR